MQGKPTREQILIVDPDPDSAEHLAALLRSAGYAPAERHTVTAALDFLTAHPGCHLVLSELHLAPHSGLDLLESTAQDHPEVVAILGSESLTADQTIEAFRRGATDVLRKPADATVLLQTVARALEQASLRRQMLAYRNNLEQLIARRTADLRTAMISLENSYDITLEAMGDALDLRDEETEGHSKRVTAYTIALARAMNLSSTDLKNIARGAFLHDIGKIAIPDAILLKPGKLTPDEATLMRTHCERGYSMIRKIPFLAEAAEIVLCHQESFDGSGYPRGLSGEDIPLGARIFAIADTLDAITSDRPYRRGATFPQALAEIARCAGTQFDPRIVATFLRIPKQTWDIIRTEVGRECHAAELVRSAAA